MISRLKRYNRYKKLIIGYFLIPPAKDSQNKMTLIFKIKYFILFNNKFITCIKYEN